MFVSSFERSYQRAPEPSQFMAFLPVRRNGTFNLVKSALQLKDAAPAHSTQTAQTIHRRASTAGLKAQDHRQFNKRRCAAA
ncbi:hypothetical protein [Paraburkholderia sp. J8-2]|uniref:hypothetical protein n=1 Tax=Paraburkholderia sp. J8-2 TaxID=2805440 RepID=UPI002AB62AAF|nr:hypothetical protein [Paraburkholderia sp. J8-2]